MTWDDFTEMTNWDSGGGDMDDFVKHQARSAAEDIFKAWLVAVQETSWSEKRAFIECGS